MLPTYLRFLLDYLIALESLDHLSQSLLFDRLGDIVLHLSMRVSLLSHGIGKEESHVVLNCVQQGQSVLVFLLSLIAETADEITGKCDPRDLRPDPIYEVKVGFPGMVTTHPCKHGSTSTLCWNVNLFANIWL